MTIAFAILIVILAASGFWLLLTFNRLVRVRNEQAEAWSGVDVQLKKRSDLVPPLVECVRGYTTHEASTFSSVTLARNQTDLVQTMRSLIALAESYPELKAAENFRQLTAQLVAIEDDLQFARRYYNGTVRDFRNLAESFPSNLVASAFQFQPREFFEVESVIERANPKVDL